jgi:hypothetical protein
MVGQAGPKSTDANDYTSGFSSAARGRFDAAKFGD